MRPHVPRGRHGRGPHAALAERQYAGRGARGGLRPRGRPVEPGGDHGHADLAVHGRVVHGAEDDLCLPPAASFTTSEIWVTSPSVRSSPPVMLMSTPVAPVIEMLSSSGDEIACCTASIARFSPRPMPVPMIAAPPFCITVDRKSVV